MRTDLTRGVLLATCGALAACRSQEQKDAALRDAVLSRHEAAVAKALTAGANPNQHTSDGTPLLSAAVSVCDEMVVPALLVAKANPNLVSRPVPHAALVGGLSALMQAASSTHCGAPMVQLLLRAGADPNLRAANGLTALMLVARTDVADSVEKARLLLAAKANVDAQDDTKRTPLMIAVTEGNKALVALLCGSGANVNLKSSEPGATALLRAAYRDDGEIVGLLVARGAQVDEVNDRGETALMVAAENNRAAVVSALLQAGANPQLVDKYGKSAADLATARGAQEALAALRGVVKP